MEYTTIRPLSTDGVLTLDMFVKEVLSCVCVPKNENTYVNDIFLNSPLTLEITFIYEQV